MDGIGCAHVVAAADVPFEQLLAYDRQCFPSARERFISTWIAQPDAVALATIDAGRVAGYGVVRRCRTGCKIGPLFADDAGVATGLFRALAARMPARSSCSTCRKRTRGRRAGRAARHDERVRNRTDVHERRAGDGNRSRVRGDVVRAGVIVTDMAVAAMATERASMGSRDVFTVVNCGKQPRIFTTCHCIPTCCFCRPALRSTWPSDRTTSSRCPTGTQRCAAFGDRVIWASRGVRHHDRDYRVRPGALLLASETLFLVLKFGGAAISSG